MKMYGSLFLSGGKKKYCLTYVILKKLDLLLTKICPRKKNSTRENSQLFTREILTSTREKISFCARENFRVPEKIFGKVGEKMIFHPRKNPKKCQKMASRALFIFSGKKKNTAQGQILLSRVYFFENFLGQFIFSRGLFNFWGKNMKIFRKNKRK